MIDPRHNPELPAERYTQSCGVVGRRGREPQTAGQPGRSLRHRTGFAFSIRDTRLNCSASSRLRQYMPETVGAAEDFISSQDLWSRRSSDGDLGQHVRPARYARHLDVVQPGAESAGTRARVRSGATAFRFDDDRRGLPGYTEELRARLREGVGSRSLGARRYRLPAPGTSIVARTAHRTAGGTNPLRRRACVVAARLDAG